MTVPDPLHTVTDSATAFEDRLAFFGDTSAPPPERFLDERDAARARAIWDATVEKLGFGPRPHPAAYIAPEPDPDRLAARVAHGYEEQEARP